MTMRVTFLGTSGAVPTTQRNTSSIFVNRDGDYLLFDCGEGTQRQMMRYGTGFAIDHLFVTHLHGDHVLGIPGLLQTWDFNERERAIAIHTPAGTRGNIKQLIQANGTTPSFPVRINEVSAGDVVLDRSEYEIRAIETAHRCASVGYVLDEDDRKGKFDREKAEEEFGIPPGPKYSKLHRGEAVEHEGETIQPEAVVGPARPGRRFVYTGDTLPTESVIEASEDADLLVHDATFAEDRKERAKATAHSTAREAADVARQAGASTLALTHISTRYAASADELVDEARDAFDGEVVLAEDGMERRVEFPDADEY
ncbi:RNAse Z [Haloarcula quadrata]|uniref:Ribonuclease Z n=5 Tax=Haloarcula TaxID=2237 RepID=RNZ_HALMA|nr:MULTISPECIES: ribonuclease Z [Haloarcula]Q5UZJ9.1 RecName: Full=Ribonuclease Z; Short=RNase Z; AltName: Full=tRNA 3 endonuclease; AltName: Full=tRNase Z [Haloarcula marismortui ATCC 43049]AAV47304.1 metallo-beta-lactamase-like [Haloarcula marismortui ATCC 43049]EMA14687.1 ribonuclease Z [Haloarcula sinaiiensis ATCC 33800]EMA16737.1 ribonuclease Z [Haloarcula californiae ATCC 33799]QCP92009.1 ribonuclease Z [Haloarcula marismortui ATCC 43049]QUJ71905.1 ribonuclease Z [Haloarcula sinaiiensis